MIITGVSSRMSGEWSIEGKEFSAHHLLYTLYTHTHTLINGKFFYQLVQTFLSTAT
jgi:hypothetical protein